MRAARMLPALVLAGLLSVMIAGAAPAGAAGLKLVEIKGADGGRFDSPLDRGPTHIASPPGDDRRIFVLTRDGFIHVIVDGVVQDEPFLDLHTRTDLKNENGAFALAFAPDYATSGVFYVNYSDQHDGYESQLNRHTIRAFRRSADDPNTADPTWEREILTIPSSGCTTMVSPHYGGQLAFKPGDPSLWVSVGDGGDGCDHWLNASKLDNLYGKILRITPDPVHGGYAVPSDNPLVGQPGVSEEIFAYGLRNPWRFTFDAEPPHDMVIGDVGEFAFEELDLIGSDLATAPQFLGWPCHEGDAVFDSRCAAPPGPAVPPLLTYDHEGGGCDSITAGPVLRDPSLGGDYAGRIMYGFFCGNGAWPGGGDNGRIYTVDPRDVHPTPRDEGRTVQAGLASFGVDGCDRVYVGNMSANVGLWRIEGERPSDCGKTTTIESGPSGAVNTTSATFASSTTLKGADVVFTCTLDGDDADCAGPLTGLAEGEHTFTATAASAAQGIVAQPASRTWTVDTTPPDTVITEAHRDGATLTYAFAATESGSSFRCSLNGAPAQPCTSPVTVAGVMPGIHTLTVAATDRAGNTDATPAAASIVVPAPEPPAPPQPGPPAPPAPDPVQPPPLTDPLPPPSTQPAAARLTGPRTLRADRRGRVTLRLARHTRGGRVTTTVRDGRRTAAGTRRIILRAGRTLSFRVRLTKAARRALHRRGHLRLTVRVTIDGGRTSIYRITVRRPR